MSFTNELSNFNASLEVTELLMKTLENAARNLAARCISEVASRHGFDAEKEIQALGKLIHNPERPLVSILGGSKVSDKAPVIEALMIKSSKILIGAISSCPLIE